MTTDEARTPPPLAGGAKEPLLRVLCQPGDEDIHYGLLVDHPDVHVIGVVFGATTSELLLRAR